ncbi:MAG TPA: PSD1 and planctomycete cytochrome C domain-containing protein [Pirellulales bacterium]|jgi:mono/diheme cytochrome c family protein|nr:PSD1 and planctomycete cytochrome C domain-containing protein [Pirellulales bacterium]
MRRCRWTSAALLVQLLVPGLASVCLADAEGVTFEGQIAPIFEARCVKCHGDEAIEAGLDLRRRATIFKGGDSGPAVVAGDLKKSLLLERIETGEMPPKDEGPLGDHERDLIRQWIAAGAPLADENEAPLEAGDAPTRVTAEDRDFWAFKPPQRPAVPLVRDGDRVRTPIDALVLARLEAKGLSFNPDAPSLVLLRRLCFDLHGLAPTVEQMEAFLADVRPDAYERLLDRLLDEPAYGERWGRHWLDLAGYADSDGYLAADRLRPEAWRYRDYVIRSLNNDLPYDKFLEQQLAGDELVDWRRADELSPEMVDCLVATGFLRTASDPTYPGYIEPNEIHQVLSDTLQIVGSAFLGLTVQCARCHSHKYDPISQRDYYSLQAIFLGALDPARWQPSEVRGIPLATERQLAQAEEQNKKTDERLGFLKATLAELTARYRKKRLAEEPAGGVPAEVVEGLVAALGLPESGRSADQKKLVADHARVPLAESDLAGRYADYQTESARLQAAISAETALKKSVPLVRGLADLDGPPVQGRVLRRGDYNQPGAPVEPGVPVVLNQQDGTFAPQAAYKTSGRRLALARWLARGDHPLTARTQVNRMWKQHFARPLVPTIANFGRSGAPPTHPELLDWLATEFVRQGWSMKAMHRLMLTSTVYRQSSDNDAATAAIDPDNRLLWCWQPRRHEGEVVRDNMLQVSGRLNYQMYGPPAPVAVEADGSIGTADDEPGRRRSIYLIVRRSQHLTMLDLFDTPVMEINCLERGESIVPMQALAMLHGPFAERAAEGLADRVLAGGLPDDEARVDYLYRLLFTRSPTPSERQAVRELIEAVAGELSTAENARRAGWVQAALVLLNSNEFLYVH